MLSHWRDGRSNETLKFLLRGGHWAAEKVWKTYSVIPLLLLGMSINDKTPGQSLFPQSLELWKMLTSIQTHRANEKNVKCDSFILQRRKLYFKDRWFGDKKRAMFWENTIGKASCFIYMDDWGNLKPQRAGVNNSRRKNLTQRGRICKKLLTAQVEIWSGEKRHSYLFLYLHTVKQESPLKSVLKS